MSGAPLASAAACLAAFRAAALSALLVLVLVLALRRVRVLVLAMGSVPSMWIRE
jgi:hypothetical protein